MLYLKSDIFTILLKTFYHLFAKIVHGYSESSLMFSLIHFEIKSILKA